MHPLIEFAIFAPSGVLSAIELVKRRQERDKSKGKRRNGMAGVPGSPGSEARVRWLKANGLFDAPGIKESARKVQPLVRHNETGQTGIKLGTVNGWVKVLWDNASKASLIQPGEITVLGKNPGRSLGKNPRIKNAGVRHLRISVSGVHWKVYNAKTRRIFAQGTADTPAEAKALASEVKKGAKAGLRENPKSVPATARLSALRADMHERVRDLLRLAQQAADQGNEKEARRIAQQATRLETRLFRSGMEGPVNRLPNKARPLRPGRLSREKRNVVLRIIQVQDKRFKLTDEEKESQFDYLARMTDTELARVLRLHLEADRDAAEGPVNRLPNALSGYGTATGSLDVPIRQLEKERRQIEKDRATGYDMPGQTRRLADIKAELRALKGRKKILERAEKAQVKPNSSESQYINDFLDTNDSLGWGKGLSPSTFLSRRLRGKAHHYKMRYQEALENAAERLVGSGYVVRGPSAGNVTTYYGKRTKPNPSKIMRKSNGPAAVDRLSKMFHGRVSGAKRQLVVSTHAPTQLARLGNLPYIKMANRPGRGHDDPRHHCRKCAIVFNPRQAMVGMSLNRRLVLAGPDVLRVGRRLQGQFRQANPSKLGEINLGKIEVMAYETPEKHSNSGRMIQYYHPHAEETGRAGDRPSLCIDKNGMLYIPSGSGRYTIGAEGIIN